MITKLAQFLRARFDEEERYARLCAGQYSTPWVVIERGHCATLKADEPYFLTIAHIDDTEPRDSGPEWIGDTLHHIARWAPDNVLKDLAAKRRIVDIATELANWTELGSSTEEEGVAILRALTGPYTGHPDLPLDWRQE